MSDQPASRPLRAARILELLEEDPFVRRLELLDAVGSTNDELRRLAAEGAPEGTVVIAERQRAGRGRLGREWHSAAGLGLYVSVLFRPSRPAEESARWTLAASVAACDACCELADCGVWIKWPNDLMTVRGKLGGILTELRTSGSRPVELVVGAGLNVLQRNADFPPELRGVATSLRIAAGPCMLERERLVAAYLSRLGALGSRLAEGDWDPVARLWEERARGARGARVRVLAPDPGGAADVRFEGVTDGLAPSGAMRVRRADGEIELVHMAESIVPAE